MATTTGQKGRRWQSPRSAVPRAGAGSRLGSDVSVFIAALAIGGSIVIGMALDVGPVTQAATVTAILVAVISPTVGLAMLSFMAPLNPPSVIPAPGFNSVLVAAIAFGCICRLPIDRPRLRISLSLFLLASFVAYVGVQQLPEMASGYSGVLSHLVGYQFMQLLTCFGTVVVAVFVLNGRSPYPFLGAGLASATIAALLAVATFNSPSVGPPIAGLIATSDLGSRAIGSFGNPNYFGMFEAFAIVTAVGWALFASGRLRIVLVAVAIVLAAGVTLSLSRGAFVALFAGVACLGFTRNRVLGVALVLGGLVAVDIGYPLFIEWRLGFTNGTSADTMGILAQSDLGRLSAGLAALQLFLSNPLFGIGWGHYSFMSGQFISSGADLAAHNWYANVLAEQGVVGVALWGLLLAVLVAELRSRPPASRQIGPAVFGAFAVGCLFLEAPGSFQTSALPIVVIVATLVADWSVNGVRNSGARPGKIVSGRPDLVSLSRTPLMRHPIVTQMRASHASPMTLRLPQPS